MNTNNTQAFPKSQWEATGMTLRDYFAAKAIQGMLAASENYTTDDLTKYAYQVSDAMLKAREKQ